MTDKQDWKVYENDIYSLLKDQFPDSVIKSNTKITGRYSIRKRLRFHFSSFFSL